LYAEGVYLQKGFFMANTQQVADAQGAKEQQKMRMGNVTLLNLKVWDEEERGEQFPSGFLLDLFTRAVKSESFHVETHERQIELVTRFERLQGFLDNLELLYKER